MFSTYVKLNNQKERISYTIKRDKGAAIYDGVLETDPKIKFQFSIVDEDRANPQEMFFPNNVSPETQGLIMNTVFDQDDQRGKY